MNRPKILVIENSTDVTGAMKAIINSASVLRSSFDFDFIIPKRSITGASYQNAGLATPYRWSMIEISRRVKDLLFYVPQLFANGLRLKRFVKQHKIDVVHVNDLYNLIPVAARLLGCKVPYVCHVRFMPERFPKRLFDFWLRVQLRYASKVIAVSEVLRRQLPPSEKIIVVYDGYPFDKQSFPSEKEGTSEPVFLHLSNIIPGKGQDHALRAFINIHKDLPGWKLRFVGGDMGLPKNKQFLQELKDLSRTAGVENRIEWLGFATDVKEQYQAADIVLNFSESESFSMSSLEALACGRPLIVTDCGGPAEIVKHEITGLLVPNKDVVSMQRAMIELANNPSLRNDIGHAAALDIRKRFNVLQTAQKLEEVYRSCLPRI